MEFDKDLSDQYFNDLKRMESSGKLLLSVSKG